MGCPMPVELRPEELRLAARQVLLGSASNCTPHDFVHELEDRHGVYLFFEAFPFEHAILAQVFYCTLFSLTILFALLGNFTVMWIILRHRQMRSVTNYYLLNLAIADASISVFNTGFSWSYNFYYVWIFGNFYCRVNNLMGITPICASVFTMIVMSIDRYWAIVHPLRRRPGKRATVSIIGGIWALAILCELKFWVDVFYFYDGETLNENPLCLAQNFPDGKGDESLFGHIYNNGLIAVQYLLPLCVLSAAYYRVGVELRKDKCVGDVRHAKSIAAKRKASFMLAVVVFIFIVVWLPYNAWYLTLHFLPAEKKILFLYIYINIYWLGMSSTVINPIIYYFMNRKFRVGFHYAFRWLPFVNSSRAEYVAILSQTRPSLLPPTTAHTTDF
ncbi:unnamed protein product [Caenorhabditis auriculariae]|uniref:G-protein coupled receptors family 1 profile domain-containing protein n=1 Tax=Caenorhabditis auriculariae TaxID=2777116 RepID=A0A8S1HPR0_9PELO|nr:unnamed protein product [Caenorhabditis auriculariae]